MIKEEINPYSSLYSARLSTYPNDLVVNLMEQPDNRRLQRHLPNYPPTRFLDIKSIYIHLLFRSFINLYCQLSLMYPKQTPELPAVRNLHRHIPRVACNAICIVPYRPLQDIFLYVACICLYDSLHPGP
jgi:hypothetical protein